MKTKHDKAQQNDTFYDTRNIFFLYISTALKLKMQGYDFITMRQKLKSKKVELSRTKLFSILFVLVGCNITTQINSHQYCRFLKIHDFLRNSIIYNQRTFQNIQRSYFLILSIEKLEYFLMLSEINDSDVNNMYMTIFHIL